VKPKTAAEIKADQLRRYRAAPKQSAPIDPPGGISSTKLHTMSSLQAHQANPPTRDRVSAAIALVRARQASRRTPADEQIPMAPPSPISAHVKVYSPRSSPRNTAPSIRSPAGKAFAVDAQRHQSPTTREPLTPKTQEQQPSQQKENENAKATLSPKSPSSPGSGSFFTNIFASRANTIPTALLSLPAMSPAGVENGNEENSPQEGVKSPVAMASPSSAVAHQTVSNDSDDCSVDPETLTDVGRFIDALHSKNGQSTFTSQSPRQDSRQQQFLPPASSESTEDTNPVGEETLAGIGQYIDAIAKPKGKSILATATFSSDADDMVPLETKVGIGAFIDSLHGKSTAPEETKQTFYVSSSDDSSFNQPQSYDSTARKSTEQDGDGNNEPLGIDNFYETVSMNIDEEARLLDDVLRDSEDTVNSEQKDAGSYATELTLNPSDLAFEDFLEADLTDIEEELGASFPEEEAASFDDPIASVRSYDVPTPYEKGYWESSDEEESACEDTPWTDDVLVDSSDAIQNAVSDIGPFTAIRSRVLTTVSKYIGDKSSCTADKKALQRRIEIDEEAVVEEGIEVPLTVNSDDSIDDALEETFAREEGEEKDDDARELLLTFQEGLNLNSAEEEDEADVPDSPQSQEPLTKVFSAMESIDEDDDIKGFLTKMGAPVEDADFFSKLIPPIEASEGELRELNEMIMNTPHEEDEVECLDGTIASLDIRDDSLQVARVEHLNTDKSSAPKAKLILLENADDAPHNDGTALLPGDDEETVHPETLNEGEIINSKALDDKKRADGKESNPCEVDDKELILAFSSESLDEKEPVDDEDYCGASEGDDEDANLSTPLNDAREKNLAGDEVSMPRKFDDKESTLPFASEAVDDDEKSGDDDISSSCEVDDEAPTLAEYLIDEEPACAPVLDELQSESDVDSIVAARTTSYISEADSIVAARTGSNVSGEDSILTAGTDSNVSTTNSAEFTADNFAEAFAPQIVSISFDDQSMNECTEELAEELVDDSVDLVDAFLKSPGSYLEETGANNAVPVDCSNLEGENQTLRDIIGTLRDSDAELFFKLSWGAPMSELNKWKAFIKATKPFLTGESAPLVAEAQIRSVASRLEFPKTDDVELIIEQLPCLKRAHSGITEAPSTDTANLDAKLGDEKFEEMEEIDESANILAFLSKMDALKADGHFGLNEEEEQTAAEELAVGVDVAHGFVNRQLQAVLSDDAQWWNNEEKKNDKLEVDVISPVTSPITSPKSRRRAFSEDEVAEKEERRSKKNDARKNTISPSVSSRNHHSHHSSSNSRVERSRSREYTPARDVKGKNSHLHQQIVRASRSYALSPTAYDIKQSLGLTQMPTNVIGDLESMLEERERRIIISSRARNAKWHNPWDRRFSSENGKKQSVPLMPRVSKKLPPLSGVDAAKSLSRWSYRPDQRHKMPLKEHWRYAYKERTKHHFGYFNVDVYSVYETSVVIAKAHRFDEEPWEQRDVKQRFLHEKSISLSRNWFGSLLRKRGNDRYREPVTHPKSMEMPMENLPGEGEWVDEWYITWQQRQQGYKSRLGQLSESRSVSDSEDDRSEDSDGSETYTYADETTMRDDETSAYSESAASESVYTDARGRSVYSRLNNRNSNRSNQSLSQFDEEDSWEDEDPPECGTFQNVKQKIGERLSLVHPTHLSSLRQSRWRRKYFPRGTFPYTR
jgi:hypothetical protein